MSCNSCNQNKAPETPVCGGCPKTGYSNSSSCQVGGGCVIPHYTAETIDEARQFKNSYVVIRGDNNAVVHTDDNGSPLTLNKLPVFESHTPSNGQYLNQLVFDFNANVAYVYDAVGAFRSWNLT
jgi:hypothetical protein